MKQIYITENQKNNIFNTVKRIFINESQQKRLFVENMEDEGAVVHVNSFGDDGVGESQYEHTKDSDMVVDMSEAGEFMSDTPNGRMWIKVPAHLLQNINPNDKVKTVNAFNPPPPGKHNEYVKANGQYYMPARQTIGKGDNVGISVRQLEVVNPATKHVETIKCFNTSMLGNNSTTAILAAHTYKGKEAPIGDKNSQKINATRQDAVLNGKQLKSVPNFINTRNLQEYMIEVRNVILNQKGLGDFNPDYILYPQSKSDFNYVVANLLRQCVFHNAQVVNEGGIIKTEGWSLDYPTLINLYDQRIESNHMNHKRYANKEFGKNGQLAQDIVLGRTIEYSFETVTSKMIAYKIKSLVDSLYITYENGFCKPKKPLTKVNTAIFNKFEELFWDEYEKLDSAFTQWNKENREKANADKYRHYVPNTEQVFLMTARLFYGIYGTKKKYKERFGNINNIFASYKELETILCKEDAPVFITPISLGKKTEEADTIKNYGTQERLSVFNQFKLDDSNEQMQDIFNNSQFRNKKYLIIDDNFASGVSLRNACQLLVFKGVPSSNIIAMTPGDMGESGTGGEIGGGVPMNNGEGSAMYDMGSGKNPYYSGYENSKDWLVSTKDDSGTTSVKKVSPLEKYRDVNDKKYADDLESQKDPSKHGITRHILNNIYNGPQNREYQYDKRHRIPKKQKVNTLENNIDDELRQIYGIR